MLLAGLVHGTLGLGFPLLATPLLALALDVRQAILLTLLPTVALNVASIARGGNWSESVGRFWPLSVWTLLGSAIGTGLLVVSDPSPFRLALAALIAVYLVASRLESLSLIWPRTHPQLSMLAFGIAAGVSAGTTNAMVPILIVYTLEMGLARTAMVQVFNLSFLAGKVGQIGVFGAAGALTADLLASTAPLALAALAALFVGMRIRDRVPGETYRRAMRAVLGLLALLLVGQFVADAL
jgi:uncharacterized membrane protein YfcA